MIGGLCLPARRAAPRGSGPLSAPGRGHVSQSLTLAPDLDFATVSVCGMSTCTASSRGSGASRDSGPREGGVGGQATDECLRGEFVPASHSCHNQAPCTGALPTEVYARPVWRLQVRNRGVTGPCSLLRPWGGSFQPPLLGISCQVSPALPLTYLSSFIYCHCPPSCYLELSVYHQCWEIPGPSHAL